MALLTTDIIDQARKITGNSADTAVGESMIPDDAIIAGLNPAIRDLASAFGINQSSKEVVFQTVVNQQDYLISSVIGTDVYSIESVIRSAAYVAPNFIGPAYVDPRTGFPMGDLLIPEGLQSDAMRAITNNYRFYWQDQFEYEVVSTSGGDVLRLMPAPLAVEWCAVRYVTTTFGIDSLPDRCNAALVYACCVSILDGQLNRIMSERVSSAHYGPVSKERLQSIEKQRNYYSSKYDSELLKIRG